MLYNSAAGSMLSQLLHSLLLLPVSSTRPLLHSLLTLLPEIDKLNRVLPAASISDEQEMEWPVHGQYSILRLFVWGCMCGVCVCGVYRDAMT